MKLHQHKNQKGVVLFVALIFLIVLTLMGVSAIETTILETKLAKALEERNYAFQTAEAGLVAIGNLDTSDLQSLMSGAVFTTVVNLTRKRRAPIAGVPQEKTFNSQATNVQASYLGRFVPQRCGSTANCSSHLRIEWVYFETSSSGIADVNNPHTMQINLANGVRQEAPSGQ